MRPVPFEDLIPDIIPELFVNYLDAVLVSGIPYVGIIVVTPETAEKLPVPAMGIQDGDAWRVFISTAENFQIRVSAYLRFVNPPVVGTAEPYGLCEDFAKMTVKRRRSLFHCPVIHLGKGSGYVRQNDIKPVLHDILHHPGHQGPPEIMKTQRQPAEQPHD